MVTLSEAGIAYLENGQLQISHAHSNDVVDVTAITSKYNNGLLHVEIPFKVTKPTLIDVTIQ
jgi:hypothetical protein